MFVAGDLLWYPVEGHPEIRQAPDAMVAFGRPKGYRGSYRQWVENDVAPQVVFEVLSPGNRAGEMERKFAVLRTPRRRRILHLRPGSHPAPGWRRVGAALEEVPEMNGWVSPRLGIRFDMSSAELQIFRPDGRRFVTYLELAAQQRGRNIGQGRRRSNGPNSPSRQAERLAAQLRALGVDPEA